MKRLDFVPWGRRTTKSRDLTASGAGVWIRTAAPSDLGNLIEHFAQLSRSSRHNRFMGVVDNVARVAPDCLICGRVDGFTLVAEITQGGRATIVGEASYAYDSGRRGEFAISVADRWRRQGLGAALLCALEQRAISLGRLGLFGEALRTNDEMKALARKAGFELSRSPDWRAIRFDKRLAVCWD